MQPQRIDGLHHSGTMLMNLQPNDVLYPLAPGNEWEYVQKDGTTFTNRVVAADPFEPQQFLMANSRMDEERRIRKVGTTYLTDAFEHGNFLPLLRDDLKAGDSWQITFKANGLDSILVMTVREIDGTEEVEGRTYTGVVAIEAESRIAMNGTVIPVGFSTHYHYARNVGLILTTSSVGDRMALKRFNLK